MSPVELQGLFEHLVWQQPGWLWLTLPVLVLPVLLARLGFVLNLQCLLGKGLEIRVPSLALGDSGIHQTTAEPASSGNIIRVLMGLVLALVCVALAQPVRQGAALEPATETEPVDAWLLASTAISTVLKDYRIDGKPADRMAMSRLVMDRFAQDFAGRRMGLILLGRPPVLWLPLSPDRNLVRDHIQRIQTTLAGRNSALGDGLALLAETQQPKQQPEKQPKQQDRIAIVITDAALELGRLSPEQGLALAREAGFTVYFIVLGADAKDGAERYQGDGLLYRPADVAAIRTLVGAGHQNQVFHATRVEVVEQALKAIQSRHRKPLEPAPDQYRQQPLYSVPLILALLVLLMIPVLARVMVGLRGRR